jgi:ATP-dependent helicase/nuclease subunit A
MVGRDDDVVRISTIHKSKGLEYPFVIVGGLGHKFRYDTNSKDLSFDPDGGVGLPYVDPARRYWRNTVLQRAINSKSKNDSYKEELRLLYVAMTRAIRSFSWVEIAGKQNLSWQNLIETEV